MFPLLLDSESLLIFSIRYLFEAYTNCIWKDHTHISDCVYLQRKREDMRKKQNKTAEALIVM